jgi:hypothetical protein
MINVSQVTINYYPGDYSTPEKRYEALKARIDKDELLKNAMITMLHNSEANLENAIKDFVYIIWQDDNLNLNEYVLKAPASLMMCYVCGIVMTMKPDSNFNVYYGGKSAKKGKPTG